MASFHNGSSFDDDESRIRRLISIEAAAAPPEPAVACYYPKLKESLESERERAKDCMKSQRSSHFKSAGF